MVKDMLRLLRDWRIWLLAFAIFIMTELTYGCAPFRWDEKGVRIEHEISNTETITVKCKTNLTSSWECRSYYQITFNMEDLLQ